MSKNGTAPVELSILTDLYEDERDREAIRQAYSHCATGDSRTFSVQFAVLLTAHAQAMKSIPRQAEIKELVKAVKAAGEGVTKLETRLRSLDETTSTFKHIFRQHLGWLVCLVFLTGVLFYPASLSAIDWIRNAFHF